MAWRAGPRGAAWSNMAKMRWPVLVLTGAAAAAALIALPAESDRLLYNHTPSVPVGFYVRTTGPVVRGAFVTVRAAAVAPTAAHLREFEGPRDRFIKRVAALEGDHVCAAGEVVTINGGADIPRRARDTTGNVLPHWNGCRILQTGEVLLLGESDDSFDGRYWGPIADELIEGVWRPL